MNMNGNTSVPQQRIREKVDECMNRRDYAGVEKVLLYWKAEAESLGDLRGELMITNEMIGHYRKTGERDRFEKSAARAEELIGILGYGGSISAATTYVNAGTALNSFGDNEKALGMFSKALGIYESSPGTAQSLLGGLYNNMGLTLSDLGRCDEAIGYFRKACKTMEKVPDGELETAVSLLNEANAVERKLGMEAAEGEIFALLDRASVLLETPSLPRDGYYAYVCEKCAPTFEYYGYFAEASSLAKTAEEIYERA